MSSGSQYGLVLRTPHSNYCSSFLTALLLNQVIPGGRLSACSPFSGHLDVCVPVAALPLAAPEGPRLVTGRAGVLPHTEES